MIWYAWVKQTAPHTFSRSCADCQAYLYDDRGEKMGAPLLRGGKRAPRPAGTKTPCRICPKIPPGREPAPASAVEETEQLRAALSHYEECRATNSFPQDPVVRWCAALFRKVEDAADRRSQNRFALTLLNAVQGST